MHRQLEHWRFVRPIAEALADLGSVRALVVHSDDGLDEISITAPTRVLHVEPAGLREETIDPASLGLATASRETLVASSLEHAALLVRGILEGTVSGAPRDMALLNAAGTLIAAGLAETFPEGLDRAAESVDRGRAAETLQRLVELSREERD